MNRDIGKIVSECINNKMIQHYFMKSKNITIDEFDLVKKNFSKMVGYCILFKESDGIEKYMYLDDIDEQIAFLKNKIANKMGIASKDIENKIEDIFCYAFENFIRNGYVFHAGNSKAIEDDMKNGLSYSENLEEKMELLHIDSIFKKYGIDRPLGWGVFDIKNKRDGWFYDGHLDNMLYYACSSPEWFSQFCGENICYYHQEMFSEESRHGYANRDYDACYSMITKLIKKNNMSEDDAKEVIAFFNKCWEKFGDTKPYLAFIPTSLVTSDTHLDELKNDYLIRKDNQFNNNLIFENIINCKYIFASNDVCCDKSIRSEDLSYVDLSPILPRYKVSENSMEKKATLRECIRKLNDLDISLLLKAEEMLEKFSAKNKVKKL